MNDLFLRAASGQVPERTPVWVMRQAGRYLPEYCAIRSKVSFLTLCRSPALAAEVTLQPIARFGFDAAIVFSDIMMPLESMGVQLDFNPGPVIAQPIASIADVHALHIPDDDLIAPYVGDTIRLLRTTLQVPLIGFCGAPLTLAAYLVEGKSSKDYAKLRALMYTEPATMHLLLHKLAQTMIRYLRMQVQAGAQALQIFDTWAGILNIHDYQTFVLPVLQEMFYELQSLGVPIIYFAQDAAALLPAMRHIGCRIFGIDWRIDLQTARSILGPDVILQGNLDPAVLFAEEAIITKHVQNIIQQQSQHHIFNLGHGILPTTPIAGVEAMLRALRGH